MSLLQYRVHTKNTKTGDERRYQKNFPHGASQALEWKMNKKKNGIEFLKFERIVSKKLTSKGNRIKKEILLSKRRLSTKIYIYALIDGDDIVYIGQSKSIMSRLSRHITDQTKKFDHYAIVESIGNENEDSSKYIDEKEAFYIKTLRPKYNVNHAI